MADNDDQHDHLHDHDHGHPHDHEVGRFSTGQEVEEESAEKEHAGDFAEGQQAGHGSVHDPPESDFAQGQAQPAREHVTERGGFARGQDETATAMDETDE
jgi:hypothetical protein